MGQYHTSKCSPPIAIQEHLCAKEHLNVNITAVPALVSLASTFVAQNAGMVALRFLFWTLSTSRTLVVALPGITVGRLLHDRLSAKKYTKHAESPNSISVNRP
jgi:uncharacterized integral membrane protein